MINNLIYRESSIWIVVLIPNFSIKIIYLNPPVPTISKQWAHIHNSIKITKLNKIFTWKISNIKQRLSIISIRNIHKTLKKYAHRSMKLLSARCVWHIDFPYKQLFTWHYAERVLAMIQRIESCAVYALEVAYSININIRKKIKFLDDLR